MEVVIIVIGIVILIIGLVSCILPPLPGAPLALLAVGLVDWQFESVEFSLWFYLIYGLFAIASTFLDNILAVYGTKKMGGTKAGVRGSFIGLLAGLFLLGPFVGPFAVIIGPFLGAVAGEIMVGTDNKRALKSGIGSFIGFLVGTGLKLGISLVLAFYFFRSVFRIL